MIFCIQLHPQTRMSINPGIKTGIAYHEKYEFVFGYELSFVFFQRGEEERHKVGIVFNYDKVNGIKRFHVGIEYLYRYVGVDIGPTFGWKDGKPIKGFSVIPFGGLFLLPYYNFTYFFGETNVHELGSYVKLAIPTFEIHLME